MITCHNCNTRMTGPRIEPNTGELYDCPRCGAVAIVDRYDQGDMEGFYRATRPTVLASLRAKAAILYGLFGGRA